MGHERKEATTISSHCNPASPAGSSTAYVSCSEHSPPRPKAQDLGDLFEYKLKDRVTIRKNQSAMVPILQSEIRAEKVSVGPAGHSSAHPLRGVWLTNTSGETLDGGNFSVLDDEIFAGQGLLDPIKPDERRLLSYATDLAMLVREAGRTPHTQYSAWPSPTA